jgi:hypothetical protein
MSDEDVLLCRACGYDVRGLSDSRCPECGGQLTPKSILSVHAECESVRKLLRRANQIILLTWLVFMGFAIARDWRWRDTRGADVFGGVPLMVLTLAMAAAGILALLEARRRHWRVRAHIQALEQRDLRGRFLTTLGLLTAPLTVILLIRWFLN